MKKLLSIILILAVLVAPVSVQGSGGKFGEYNKSVFGRWTLYLDAREYNKTSIAPLDFDIQSLDLFIFENGACYLQTFELSNGAVKPSTPVTGMWIGDEESITMQFGDQVYKADAGWGILTLHTMGSDFTLTQINSIDPYTYFAE